MENKHKHLDFIQGVINRMAGNSFALKGWAVTLIAGIFVLAGKDTDKMYFLVAYIPILVFWGLDSFYLLQERLYRALYNKVRKMSESEIDFSMNANLDEFKTISDVIVSNRYTKELEDVKTKVYTRDLFGRD